jgi:hypothetical protein
MVAAVEIKLAHAKAGRSKAVNRMICRELLKVYLIPVVTATCTRRLK